MLWPQNWYSTGYIAMYIHFTLMYIHCTVLQLQKKIIQWRKDLVYLKDIWRRNVVLPSKSNSVISWNIFCHDKSHRTYV